jgi:hypothetical protein
MCREVLDSAETSLGSVKPVRTDRQGARDAVVAGAVSGQNANAVDL